MGLLLQSRSFHIQGLTILYQILSILSEVSLGARLECSPPHYTICHGAELILMASSNLRLHADKGGVILGYC